MRQNQNHPLNVKSWLSYLSEKDPDIFLVSHDGVIVGSHRLVLRLVSTVLSDVVVEDTSHVSVPASGSVLNTLLTTLYTGIAITNNKEVLGRVAELADLLGFGYVDWQIGLGRKKKRKIVEEMKKENEHLNGFVFNEEKGEDTPKLDDSILINPAQEQSEAINTYDDQIIKTEKTKDLFSCQPCDKTFSWKKSFKKHQILMHETSTETPVSSKISPNRIRFKCDVCDKTFATKKGRRKHVRVFHEVMVKNEPKDACKVCNKVHGYNPKNDEHYDCDVCKSKIYSLKNFKKHQSERHGMKLQSKKIIINYDVENPNHCHECKSGCRSPADLIFHQDTKHVTDSPGYLSCRYCERKISRKQKGYFIEHLRTHTGERPEICTFCGNSFKHKKALKNHERLHTGEKPYKCELCFSAFTQRNGLISHQKSKNGCNIK